MDYVHWRSSPCYQEEPQARRHHLATPPPTDVSASRRGFFIGVPYDSRLRPGIQVSHRPGGDQEKTKDPRILPELLSTVKHPPPQAQSPHPHARSPCTHSVIVPDAQEPPPTALARPNWTPLVSHSQRTPGREFPCVRETPSIALPPVTERENRRSPAMQGSKSSQRRISPHLSQQGDGGDRNQAQRPELSSGRRGRELRLIPTINRGFK